MNHSVPSHRLVVSAGTFALLLVVFLAASCGGGGGGDEAAPVEKIGLGEMSATNPTKVTRSWLNPLSGPATVRALPSTGPFAFDPLDLPASAGALGTANIGIIFTPEGPGPATGLITLQFVSGGDVANRTFEVSAVGEAINYTINPDPIDFGDVLPGNDMELDITVRNDSQRSPVTFTSAQMPNPAFSFTVNPLPISLAPGQSRTMRVRFAPTAVANLGGFLRLGANDVGGPLDLQLWANASGAGEQIIDLGTQALSNGDTPILTVDVPADAVSVTFEGTCGEGDEVSLRSLEGPGNKVYTNNQCSNGPVNWTPWRKTFSFHLPSCDMSAAQLVQGGGIYRFQMRRTTGTATSMDVRVILERRPSGASTSTVLPLNIYLAQGIPPTAATAENDADLQAMITQMGQIFAPHNISIGDIDYYDIASPSFNQVAQGEERDLMETSSVASKVRLNLFLVQQVWGGQLLGLSAAVDGAKKNGTSASGMVSIYVPGNPGATAAVVVHELCHYLGLWHTVEVTGVFDPIGDTPQCPVTGTNATCSVAGGGMLMHWQALGGTTISAGQGKVLRGHACCHPPGQTNALRAKPKPWVPDAKARAFLENLPAGWCGTQRR